jgi:exopolysaccharide biosynthesis polyprenyl glycosylphosphotransferase
VSVVRNPIPEARPETQPEEDIMAALDERTRASIAEANSPSARRARWVVRRGLVVADVVALLLTFGILELGYQPNPSVTNHVSTVTEFALFMLMIPVWILMASLYGLYDQTRRRPDHGTMDDVVGVFHMIGAGLALLLIVGTAADIFHPNTGKVVTFWFLALTLVVVARACARAVCKRQAGYGENAIIVGTGEVGQLAAHKILQHPEYGINLLGFVDDAPLEMRPGLSHLRVLSRSEQVRHVVELLNVDRVIIAFTNERHDRTLALIRSLNDLDVQVDIVPRFFELVPSGPGVHAVEGLPLIALQHPRLSRSSRLLKRLMDVVGATLGLLLLSPLFAYVAIRIRRESHGPVFFRQTRIGTDGREFTMYKFRTMTADAERRKAEFAHLNVHRREGGDPRMFKIVHDPRVTPFGSFLRRYSLDELPQLVNVVRGDMSLVGPRPLIPEEAEYVADWARKRLGPKPGITGLWQVLGRSGIPFDEMTKLDYLYVTNWSLRGDVRILLQTIPAVFRRPRVD